MEKERWRKTARFWDEEQDECGTDHRNREWWKWTRTGEWVEVIHKKFKCLWDRSVGGWTMGLKTRPEFGIEPWTYELSTYRQELKPQVWMILSKEKGWRWMGSGPDEWGTPTFMTRWRKTTGSKAWEMWEENQEDRLSQKPREEYRKEGESGHHCQVMLGRPRKWI